MLTKRKDKIRRGRKRAPAAVLLAALVLCGFAAPTHAAPQPNEMQVAAFEHAPEQQRVQLLIHLAKSGQHDQAEWLLARFPLSGPHAENRTLYLEGLILKARRDYSAATEKFRAALAHDPKLTLVRAELAQTLVILEQDDSAAHHLRLLAADAPTDEAAQGVRSFADQVDARSPLKFNAWASLAPTSNANNGTTNTKVYDVINRGWDIGADQKQKQAYGVATGFNAALNKRIGNRLAVTAAANQETRLYDDKKFNSMSLSESLELRVLTEGGHISAGGVASQNLDPKDLSPSYRSYGPRLALRHAFDSRNTFAASGIYEWRDYATDSSDGTAFLLDANFTHAFNASLNVSGLFGYDRVKQQIDYNSYRSWMGGLAVYKELPFGVTANVGAQVRYSYFDAPQFIFGLREDTRLTGNVSLTKRDLNLFGFAPTLSYTYNTNFSSIDLYDFESHAIDMRFTKDF